MHSCHVFIFPFRWELNDPGDEKLPLQEIATHLNKSPWERHRFQLDTPPDYNIYSYFYDFARKGLLDCAKNEKHEILHHYRYRLPERKKKVEKKKEENNKEKDKQDKVQLEPGPRYRIATGQKTYELDIEKIELEFYATGVGFLVFFLENNLYHAFHDILKINEFGRRIYPQFLGTPKPDEIENTFTTATKNAFLASGIALELEEGKRFEDDFSFFDNMDNVKGNPNHLPEFIHGLLGKQTFSTREGEGKVEIRPVVDDRMFVLCWYGNEVLAAQTTGFRNGDQSFAYEYCDDWYKFLYIDVGDATCQSPSMMRRLLRSSTYDRWAGNKTLYGCSRYSFNVLSQNSADWLCNHLKTMYYQMVKLTLLQRASILRFSDEASKIADEIKHYDKKKAGDCKLKILHQDYLWFVNRLYFREVTAQEQGIELYNLMQEKMEISRDIKDLDREIDDLYQFEGLEADRESNRKVTYLTILAGIFLLPTFISGFFGMNLLPATYSQLSKVFVIAGIVSSPLLVYFAFKIYELKVKKSRKWGFRWYILLSILILLAILLLPITSCGNFYFGGPL